MLEIWNLSDKTTELIFSTEENSGYIGHYETINHRITIFLPDLLKSYKENSIFNSHMLLTEFSRIIIAHELSHSIDPLVKDSVSENTRINKEIRAGIEEKNQNKIDYNYMLFQKNTIFLEIRAWVISRRLFSQYFNKESLYIVMRDNLGPHFNLYKQHIKTMD
jgi:hypothetical protein